MPARKGRRTPPDLFADQARARTQREAPHAAAGVPDRRRIVDEAGERRGMYGQRTILFIDEIHRFNKAQQDVILPFVEDGVVTLIGATTENRSFEVISPLLSRCRVYSLNPLSPEQLEVIVRRAMTDPEHGLAHLTPRADYEAP